MTYELLLRDLQPPLVERITFTFQSRGAQRKN